MFRKKPQPSYGNPEWLIVGLGNPGPEYKGTRHNVGFEVIDMLATRHRIKVDRGRNRALFGIGQIGSTVVGLVKPLTYMNLSGQSVAPLARQQGVPPERIIVVADDKDMVLGKLKIPERGSSGGHNGHKSLIAALGTSEYPRVKIGIGEEEDDTIDHVLGKFTPDERGTIDDALKAVVHAIDLWITEDRDAALRSLEKYGK
jgi:peptidyl-tRNA hydrolase, PTH1 family